jgi:predicted amidohydrolase
VEIIASAIQMVSTDNIEQNIDEALRLLNIAVADQSSNLIVFPENFLCFGKAQQQYLATNLSVYLSKFQSIAKNLSINLVLGSVPSLIREDGTQTDGRFRSASYVINTQGNICCQYDKINLFDVDVDDPHGEYRESETFEAGKSIKAIDIDAAKLGLSICYDLRFPELYQSLRLAGANVLTIPAAFTKVTGRAHWETLLRARAIETQSFIVAANQGGTHSGQRETWGHSMIIDPWGEILSEVGFGAGVCSALLDMSKLNQIRASMPLYRPQ